MTQQDFSGRSATSCTVQGRFSGEPRAGWNAWQQPLRPVVYRSWNRKFWKFQSSPAQNWQQTVFVSPIPRQSSPSVAPDHFFRHPNPSAAVLSSIAHVTPGSLTPTASSYHCWRRSNRTAFPVDDGSLIGPRGWSAPWPLSREVTQVLQPQTWQCSDRRGHRWTDRQDNIRGNKEMIHSFIHSHCNFQLMRFIKATFSIWVWLNHLLHWTFLLLFWCFTLYMNIFS